MRARGIGTLAATILVALAVAVIVSVIGLMVELPILFL